MPITVTCSCGKQFQTNDQNAGRTARCPNCGSELIVPGPGPGVNLEDAFATAPATGGPAQDVGAKAVVPGTSGKAIASFVLGLLSFVCSIFTGIPAIVLGYFGLKDVKQSGGLRTGKGFAIAGIVLGSISSLLLVLYVVVLVALLVPAMQAARDAARRAQCTNNLKQIGLAMHNYLSANDCFPPTSIADNEGRPMHSWRVMILPYMEASAAYNAYNFNLPWDSPSNTTVQGMMPHAYTCPSYPPTGPNMTHYQVVVGPGTVFEKPNAVTTISQVTDGTSNTLLVVESITPIPWTQPTDLVYTPNMPITGVGGPHRDMFNALFADGSVRALKNSLPATTLEKFVTRAGNEPIEPNEY
jgi:prepilin-type processing-associated H-X9-DG protein